MRCIDGKPMRCAAQVPAAHWWITDGTRFLSGGDFISCVHSRLGVLYSRARGSRGRDKDNSCRRGCGRPETLDHILQKCYSTHRRRIMRHDAVLAYLQRACLNRGYTVHKEKAYSVNDRKYVPDLVLYNEDEVLVADVQVISENYDLNAAHREKTEKYRPLFDQLQGLRPNGVSATSLTLSWRGVICRESADDFLMRGILKKKDLKIISTRALVGNKAIWREFQNMTLRRKPKEGVG